MICSNPEALAASYVPGMLQSNEEYLNSTDSVEVKFYTKAFDEAFANSRITSTWSFLERCLLVMPWIVAMNCVTVDLRFLNPWCLFAKMLRWSKCRVILLCTTLQVPEVSKTYL